METNYDKLDQELEQSIERHKILIEMIDAVEREDLAKQEELRNRLSSITPSTGAMNARANKKEYTIKKMSEPIRNALKTDEIITLSDEKGEVFWYVNLSQYKLRVVEKNEGCWDWKGSYHKQGYGMILVKRKGDRSKSGMMNAQKLALGLKLGRPLKPGERTTSTCGKLDCCNPDHLHLIDYQEQFDKYRVYTDEFLETNKELLALNPKEIAPILGVSFSKACYLKRALKSYLQRLQDRSA